MIPAICMAVVALCIFVLAVAGGRGDLPRHRKLRPLGRCAFNLDAHEQGPHCEGWEQLR